MHKSTLGGRLDLPTSYCCPHHTAAHLILLPTSHCCPHHTAAHITLLPTSHCCPHHTAAHIILLPTSHCCPHHTAAHIILLPLLLLPSPCCCWCCCCWCSCTEARPARFPPHKHHKHHNHPKHHKQKNTYIRQPAWESPSVGEGSLRSSPSPSLLSFLSCPQPLSQHHYIFSGQPGHWILI